MNRRLLLCLLCYVSATMPAVADLSTDWYANFAVGWNHVANMKFREPLDEAPAEPDATIDLDFGAPVGSLSIGFEFGNGWRMELEGAYRRNDTEILYFPASGSEIDPDPIDRVEATSVLVNVLHDFELGTALQPYVGVGLGAAWMDYHVSESRRFSSDTQRPRRPIIDDQATSLAFQLIAGFTVPLTRRLDLAADYRYWRAPSVDLREATGRELDTEYAAHSTWISLRYHSASTPRRVSLATQRGNGSYLATHFGTGFAVDAEIKDNRSNFDAFDIGPVATLAVGRARGDRWRFELEAALRRNAAEVVDFNPEIGEDRATGTVRAISLMTNAIYRFYPQSAIAPFAGVGAGLVWADYNVKVLGSTFIDDDDTALGAQAIFGVDIALSPRLTFSADYRLWYASGIKMRQPDGRRLKTNHLVHSVMAGLRYSFATAR